MCEILGYNNFCAACNGSEEENGELVCKDKNGKFYGLPVKQVLAAPCIKKIREAEKLENEDRG